MAAAEVQTLLDVIFSSIPGNLGFLDLCDGLIILAPFHRPHGHLSALLSCSHARSALHFFPYSLRHGGRNNLLQIWHDVVLGYQVRMNRHAFRQQEQRLGNKAVVEITSGHRSISEHFFFKIDRTLFHVISTRDRSRLHGCATGLLSKVTR